MLHPREDYARIQDPAGLIPENEPVFILRAQDKMAARTVRHWAQLNMDHGGDPELSCRAVNHAALMDAWPVKKLADLPERSMAAPPAELGIGAMKIEGPNAGQKVESLIDTKLEPESKPGSGIVSGPAEPESKPGAGVVSTPEKSQNDDGSGVV